MAGTSDRSRSFLGSMPVAERIASRRAGHGGSLRVPEGVAACRAGPARGRRGIRGAPCGWAGNLSPDVAVCQPESTLIRHDRATSGMCAGVVRSSAGATPGVTRAEPRQAAVARWDTGGRRWFLRRGPPVAGRNIEIILAGLADAVRSQDPERSTELLSSDVVWQGVEPGLRC